MNTLKRNFDFKIFKEDPTDFLIKYEHSGRTVYIFKCDAQVDLKTYDNYPLIKNCQWYKPKSKDDAQALIDKCNEIKINGEATWTITKFVETDPINMLFGGFNVKVDGGGYGAGDNNINGKCDGNEYTAIRKGGSSFARPKTFNKGCCWDSSYKFFFLALEK